MQIYRTTKKTKMKMKAKTQTKTKESTTAAQSALLHIISPIFFIVFFVLTNYVLLNLLVAVIIDSFVAVSDLNKGVVTPEDIEEFKKVWAQHDEDGDAMIPVEALVEVVMELSFPLGISNIPGQTRKSKLTSSLWRVTSSS